MSNFENGSLADTHTISTLESECNFINTELKLDIKLIRLLIKIGTRFNQSGNTILNTIFQIEDLNQRISSNNEFIIKIQNVDVIGCFLLSSKYFEQRNTRLRPCTLQEIFPSYSRRAICEIEIKCIKKLKYEVDKLYVNQFNFWSCTDRIILDFKGQFKLTEKYYIKLCGMSQKISLELMYQIGHKKIAEYDDKSLAAAIILCALHEMKSNKNISNIMNLLVVLSRYKNKTQLMMAVKDLKRVISMKPKY